MSNLTDFLDTVNSVNGRKGSVTLTKTDVGLDNVPNTDATNIDNLTGVLPVTKGGTGETTIEAFKTSLNIEGVIPSGGIIMWSGSIATIPSGWALCNGSNGTPNLRNRFIVGAGSTYAVGATGGSANAVVVAHSHSASTGSAGNHSHSGSTNSTGSHRHLNGIGTTSSHERVFIYSPTSSGTPGSANRRISGSAISSGNPTRQGRTNSTGSHSHSLSINSNGSHTHSVSVNSSGESGSGKNLPPYYALAYIMKL